MLLYSAKFKDIPYEIRELKVRTKPYNHQNRVYPIVVKSKVRCWGCDQFFESLPRCTRCLSVRYCSRICQEKHWKAGHKGICRSPAFYLAVWAKILVPTLYFRGRDISDIVSTALYLIDHQNVHPDNIRLSTDKKGYEAWEYSYGLFDLTEDIDLIPFLERGLTPQEVVDNTYFGSFWNYKNAGAILEYGSGEARFPQQDYGRATKFLINYHIDPDEIIEKNPIYSPCEFENIILLASVGYNFYQKNDRGETRLDTIKDAVLVDKVKGILKSRSEEIRNVLIESLISDLIGMIFDYLKPVVESETRVLYLKPYQPEEGDIMSFNPAHKGVLSL